MAADDRLVSGALRQAGVVRMSKYSDLVLAAKGSCPHATPQRQGHWGARSFRGYGWFAWPICCDRDLRTPCAGSGGEVDGTAFSPSAQTSFECETLWTSGRVRRIHGAETAYREGMEAVLMDPNVDAVVSDPA
ncbi:MAG: hypothetical protein MZU91_00065 [Desulfosudis oleivorans]|nr:hypothetical protein [Desulfosudis oleivorans]